VKRLSCYSSFPWRASPACRVPHRDRRRAADRSAGLAFGAALAACALAACWAVWPAVGSARAQGESVLPELRGPTGELQGRAPFTLKDEANLPPLTARRTGEPMSVDRLDALIRRAGEDVRRAGTNWRFQLAGREVHVLSDPRTDRMRILVAVRDVSGLDARELYRLLQADFETAIDARYAIAREMLWSVFVHPLRTLDDMEFLSGLGQTVNLAASYGTTYSSGGQTVGGGGPTREQQELIERLLRLKDAI
jgi:hypothetical protein